MLSGCCGVQIRDDGNLDMKVMIMMILAMMC